MSAYKIIKVPPADIREGDRIKCVWTATGPASIDQKGWVTAPVTENDGRAGTRSWPPSKTIVTIERLS